MIAFNWVSIMNSLMKFLLVLQDDEDGILIPRWSPQGVI